MNTERTRFLRLTLGLAAGVLASASGWGAVTWVGTDATWSAPDSDSFSAAYADGADVIFNDSSAVVGVTVAAGGVTPASTTCAASTSAYTFTGGSILGGTLSKSGTARLTLNNGANSFSGVTLSGGVLAFTNNNQVGSGTIAVSGNATLFYNNPAGAGGTLTNPLQVANGVILTLEPDILNTSRWDLGGLVSGGTSGSPVNLIFQELSLGSGNFDGVALTNAANSFVGTVTVGNRSQYQYLGNDGVFGATANSIAFAGNGYMNLNGFTLSRNVSFGNLRNGTVSGKVTGDLVPNGSTVILTNTSNSIGTVTLQQLAVLQISDPGNVGAAPLFHLASPASSPGTLRITGTPSGNFTGTLRIEADISYVDVPNAAAVVNWTGPVATRASAPAVPLLNKTGAGTLNLASVSGITTTRPLAMTVQAGRLNINDPAPTATGFGNVTVAANATLGGTGKIDLASGKSVAVQASGILAPGQSVGTLSVTGGNVDLATGSYFDAEFATGGFDRLSVTGIVNLNSATLRLFDLGTFITTPTTYTVVSATTLNGQFAGLADGAILTFRGFTAQVSYTGTEFRLVNFIPEPGTAVLLAAGVCAALRRRRK